HLRSVSCADRQGQEHRLAVPQYLCAGRQLVSRFPGGFFRPGVREGERRGPACPGQRARRGCPWQGVADVPELPRRSWPVQQEALSGARKRLLSALPPGRRPQTRCEAVFEPQRDLWLLALRFANDRAVGTEIRAVSRRRAAG